MPSAILDVVPNTTGDYARLKISGAAALDTSALGLIVGYVNNGFPVADLDNGWIGRFEMPVPNGARITGASLSFYCSAASSPTGTPVARMAGGLIAADGLWDAAGGTFSISHYPTRSDMPWPERDALPVVTRWFRSSPAFMLATFASVGSASTMSFGEGIAVTNTVTGLVAALQDWLDTYGPTLRGGSVSGTDLPVALCWFRAYASFEDPTEGFPVFSSRGIVGQRPQLTIEWSLDDSPGVHADGRVRPAIHATRRVLPAISPAQPDVRPQPGARGRIR
jgi:hypothetical protein